MSNATLQKIYDAARAHVVESAPVEAIIDAVEAHQASAKPKRPSRAKAAVKSDG